MGRRARRESARQTEATLTSLTATQKRDAPRGIVCRWEGRARDSPARRDGPHQKTTDTNWAKKKKIFFKKYFDYSPTLWIVESTSGTSFRQGALGSIKLKVSSRLSCLKLVETNETRSISFRQLWPSRPALDIFLWIESAGKVENKGRICLIPLPKKRRIPGPSQRLLSK